MLVLILFYKNNDTTTTTKHINTLIKKLIEHVYNHSNLNHKLGRLFHKETIKSPVANICKINGNYQQASKTSTQLKNLLQLIYKIKFISEQVNYIYAACFSPVKSTFLKAINAEYFSAFFKLNNKKYGETFY